MTKLPALASIHDVAKILNVSTKTLRRWEERGVLTPVRTEGGHRRYELSKIRELKGNRRHIRLSSVLPTPPAPKIESIPVLYTGLHVDQKKVLGLASVFTLFALMIYAGIRLTPDDIREQISLRVAGHKISKDVSPQQGTVLAAVDGSPSFNINIESAFKDNALFTENVQVDGDLTLNGQIIGNVDLTGVVIVGGNSITSSQSTFNLLDTATATLNIGGAASIINLGPTGSGTSSIVLAGGSADTGCTIDGSTGALTCSGGLTSGSLAVSGNATFGNITAINGVTYAFPSAQGGGDTFLKNNGSGTLTWATPALTALSGVLPIANGGTNNSTSYSAGSVIFSDGTKLTQDNSNFFWDDSNNRLGIGNTAPTVALDVTGNVAAVAFVQSGNLVCDAAGNNCPAAGSGGSKWKLASGAVSPFSDSLDVLIGSSASTSAKFAFTGVASGTPTASISGTTANVATYLTGEGNLATTNMNHLTLGGSTTGQVDVNNNLNLSSGNAYLINNTSVLNATTLGSGVVNSSLTGVSALTSGSIASGFGTIATANTITGTTLNGTTGVNTGAGAGTQRIDSTGNLTNINDITAAGTVNLAGLTASQVVFTDASKNLTSTGTVGADQGGTGFASYAVGDLLYADTTSTLAKLADVATGNVLISGGVNTAPAWGKVTLGTHTSGNYVSSLAGTANQITASASTGDITLSIPSDFRAPGTVNAVTGLYTGAGAGTVRIDSSGNVTATDLSSSGNSTLGDAITDTITFSGRVAEDNDLIPIGTTGTNDLGSASLPWDNVYANAFIQNGNTVCDSSGANCPVAGSGGSKWRLGSGVLTPFTDTLDVLLGSTATASAKIALINVTSGIPTASISGTTANVATYLNGEGNLSTTNMADLTLGSSTTGNVVINSRGSSALTANGANLTTTGTFTLPSTNTLTGVSNYLQLNNGISVGGATTYYFDASGNINANAGTFAGTLTANGDTVLGNAITDNITFTGRVAQDSDLIPIGTTGTNDLGTALLPWDNVYAVTLSQNGNTVCDSSGNCLGGSGGSKWKLTNGAISPFSDTLDVLIGNSATTSAKFAFTGVNSGLPTASISGTTANVATYLTGEGNLATTNMNHLTLGGGTTGQVDVNNNLNVSTGNGYLINNASVLNATTLGSAVVNSSLTQVGALASGSIASGFGTIATANTITGTTLNGTTGVNTGASAGTQRIDSSGNLVNINDITAAGTVNLAGLTASKAVFTDGSKNLTSTGTVGADQGGTGFSSYAVGDLLYADTTSTLGKLADIATGNVLLSGGVNTAPAWGKVTLGTHTSGNYVSSLAGTANQITASAATGDITLSIPSDFRAPGTVNAVTGIYTGAGAGTVRIDSSGNVTAVDLSSSGNTTLGDAITDTITFTGRVAQDNDLVPIGTTGTNDLGSASLPWDNVYANAFIQGGNNVCDSSGANCPAAGSGGSKWKLGSGTVSPFSDTLDVLIGSSATASAKFAFINTLTGTPTASISGTTANVATYLNGEGNLSTTNMQGLTLGSATTGNVVLNSRGSAALTANGIDLTTGGDLAVNGGDLTTSQTTATLFNTTATTLSLGGAATTALNIGNGSGNYTSIALGSGAGTHVIDIAGTGAIAADTINIGTGGTAADTVTIGSTLASTALALNDDNWNITGGGLANFVSIGAATPGTGAFTTLSATGDVTLNDAGADTILIGAAADTLTLTSNTLSLTDDNWSITAAGVISASTGTSTALNLTRSAAGQWIGFNDGTDIWGLYNTAGSPEGALAANTGALSMDTTNGTLYVKTDDTDNTGWVNLATGASSPFTSAGGIIDKTDVTERLRLLYGDAADTQFTIENTTNSTIPTVDAAVIDLTGNTTGIVTDGVDVLSINAEFGNGTTNTNSLINLALSGVNTPSGDEIFNAINIAALSGTGATETAINIGSGWDTGINANANTITNIGNAGTDFDSSGGLTLAGTLTANGTVNLGDGGDVVTVSGSDTNIAVIDGSVINIDGDGSPTADLVQLGSGDTSATSGVDGLFINLAMSNASGDSIHITPAFAGGATDTLTYNGIELDAFSPTNAAGTDIVNGLKLGNLTDPGATITSTALNIGTGWDSLLSYNGTPVINGSGQIISTQINGTLFSNSSDSNAGTNTIVQGDTLAISGGTNGVDTSLTDDTYTINLDTTEVGTTTFGSGSSVAWTFNSGTTDPVLTFGDNALTIGSAATITATDVTAFNCTDCLNFDDLADSLTLDAATDINLGASLLSIDLDSTGDFAIRDGATAFVTFNEDNLGQVVLADGSFLDLSAIVHDDTTIQGFLLPQNTALTNPASGEGFLAWDSDDNQVKVYNGTSWANISGASTTLQEAYSNDVDGSDTLITLDATDGSLIVKPIAGTSFQVAQVTSAPTTDIVAITNTGLGTTTDGVDGLSLTFVTGDGATPTNNGINLALTSGGTAAGDVLNGINFGLTGTSGTERGLNFSDNNFDTDINATTDLTVGIGGTNELTLTATNFAASTAEGNSLGSSSLEWEQLFLGDDNGIAFGLDQDWTFAYDEATDDRLELVTAGTSGLLVQTANATGTSFNLASNSLTTGTGLYVNSSSITTGTLMTINATGTTLTTGKLFDVQNNSSSVFNVAAAQITSALPHQFTAAGDVNIAYDLIFTNQTASTIDSYGPLTIRAGESFENNNLTLKTYGSGKIITDGAFSLNSQETLTDSTTPDVGGASYFLEANSTNRLVTNMTNGTAGQIVVIEVGTANLDFDCAGSEATLNCGNADITSAAGDMFYWIYDGTDWNLIEYLDLSAATQAAGTDVAEYFPSVQTLAPGEVVKVDPEHPEHVIKSASAYESSVVGIVTTNPGIVLGESENSFAIALAGRVPVKMSQSSASIIPGDYITTSSEPGKATKATGNGRVIGQALENWSPDSGKTEIVVFINNTWYEPVQLTANGDVGGVGTAADPNNFEYALLTDSEGNVINKLSGLVGLIAENIKSAYIETVMLKVDTLLVNLGLISPSILTNNISPLADETDINIQVGSATKSGKLAIKNAADEIVAEIDSAGNATFSGEIRAGTIYADQIIAKNAQFGDTSTNTLGGITREEIEALLNSVEQDQNLLNESQGWSTNTATGSAVLNELSLENLYVTGTAAMSSLSLTESLILGSDFVIGSTVNQLSGSAANTIDTLNNPLSLQSSASQPLHIMAGKVQIDTLGNMQVLGNLAVGGVLSVSAINIAEDPNASISGTVNGNILNSLATAGEGQIASGSAEITLVNPNINAESLIFVTPTSQVTEPLYIKSKDVGTATIGFTNQPQTDVTFNWWIVGVAN